MNHLLNILSYSHNLKPATRVELSKLVKTKKISVKAGKIVYENKPIMWEKLKSEFKKGKILEPVMRAIGGLRKCTLFYLFSILKIGKKCYTEIGSDTPTSDLDFTYVSYKTPKQAVAYMVRFYDIFREIYGNYPDVTFDTNYYILSMIVSPECHSETKKSLRSLFNLTTYNKYIMKNYKNQHCLSFDNKICFYIQKLRLKADAKHESTFSKLVDTSSIFYKILDDGTPNSDEKLMLLRTLSFFMGMYSNEAYISDVTLKLILFKTRLSSNDERYIAYMDQFIFINEWFEIYKSNTGTRADIEFFDVVSKYIYRAGLCLKGSQMFAKIPSLLLQHADFWRSNVRGKMSIDEALELQKVKDITEKLPTKKYIFDSFKLIYTAISKKMHDTSVNKFIKSIQQSLLSEQN